MKRLRINYPINRVLSNKAVFDGTDGIAGGICRSHMQMVHTDGMYNRRKTTVSINGIDGEANGR